MIFLVKEEFHPAAFDKYDNYHILTSYNLIQFFTRLNLILCHVVEFNYVDRAMLAGMLTCQLYSGNNTGVVCIDSL